MSSTSSEYPNPLHQLGKYGIKLPAIGYGTMGLSSIYGASDDAASLELFREAVKLGCLFWDTANAYGWGHNEKLVGTALKDCRDKVFLCTKFGLDFDEGVPALKGIAGGREYVLKSCDDSLRRLGVDHIDLYYYHRVDRTVPIEETVGAMKELQDSGKIKYIGLSECSKETLERALKVVHIDAVQVEFSPWETAPEATGLLDVMRKNGVSLVAYSPLGRGMLTGQIKSPADLDATDFRHTDPRYSAENFPLNLRLVERLSQLAADKAKTLGRPVTPAAFCLAWVLYQGPDVFVIPGTRSVDRLKENLTAGKVLESFTKEDDEAVKAITTELGVVGERYMKEMMGMLEG